MKNEGKKCQWCRQIDIEILITSYETVLNIIANYSKKSNLSFSNYFFEDSFLQC